MSNFKATFLCLAIIALLIPSPSQASAKSTNSEPNWHKENLDFNDIVDFLPPLSPLTMWCQDPSKKCSWRQSDLISEDCGSAMPEMTTRHLQIGTYYNERKRTWLMTRIRDRNFFVLGFADCCWTRRADRLIRGMCYTAARSKKGYPRYPVIKPPLDYD